MSVSDYIVQFLVDKGIKDVFFLEGSACATLIVSVARNKKLKYYCPRHEQAGAFAIDGYYKVIGKVGAMIATSGPGGQNLLNGVAASFFDSCPAIYITGQINSRFIRPNEQIRQRGFQENDIVAMAKPITKYTTLVRNAADIRYELEKAYYLATSGRFGPVLLDIPMDIQKAPLPENLKRFVPPKEKPYQIKKIAKCLEWLYGAKRPVILLGGGVWLANAIPEIKRMVARLDKVPVYVTWNMIDYYDPKHYAGHVGTYCGPGRNFGIQNSDFFLAIGSRISGRITGGMTETFARAAKKVMVNVDEPELEFNDVKPDLPIYCDAKTFAQEMLKCFDPKKLQAPDSWMKQAMIWKNKYVSLKPEYWKQKKHVNPYVFVKVLSDLMKKGDTLVNEAAGNCVISSQAFEAKDGQRIFSNNGNSSLGYALPAAIGAAIATDRKVVCITGDGGLNFNIQEFETLKYLNLPVKVLIFNNEAFGITKAYRDTHFQSEYAGVDSAHGWSSPDFVKVARAYGLRAIRINNHKDLRRKLKWALAQKGPVVCDIDMEGFYDYQPRLGWRQPIEDMYPFLPRDEFRQNMIIEPHPSWKNPTYP